MVTFAANFPDNEAMSIVLEADSEIQLKVWKDLAISKQVLMTATTKALGLNAECSTEELQSALKQAIKRAKEADTKIAGMSEKADKDLAAMRELVRSSEEALAAAQEQAAEAIKAREAIERRLEIGRNENAKALKAAKAEVVDNQKKLKAISKLLADTPENVVKKLKTLKKQKLDDARIRTQIETKLRTACKEKSDLEQELDAQSARLSQAATLVEKLREMQDLCKQANKKIESLSEDGSDLIEIPALDEELLEALGKTGSDQGS